MKTPQPLKLFNGVREVSYPHRACVATTPQEILFWDETGALQWKV